MFSWLRGQLLSALAIIIRSTQHSRKLLRIYYYTMRSAQRCLFGRPSDHDRRLEMEKLKARMKEVVDAKSKEYNFDFNACRPIPGDAYVWEEVPEKIRRPGRISRSASHTAGCDERCEPFPPNNKAQQHQHPQQHQQQQQTTTDRLQTAAIANGVTDRTRLQEVRDAAPVERANVADVPKVENFIHSIQKKRASSLESLVSRKLLRKRSFITDYYPLKKQKNT